MAAITGTALISYLGMRLWVFVSKRPKKHSMLHGAVSRGNARGSHSSWPVLVRREAFGEREQHSIAGHEHKHASNHSLSVVLPTYNEEQVIASTVSDILTVLSRWQMDVEVLLLLTISLSWAVAVDLTPAASRPYVGSSQDNSEVESGTRLQRHPASPGTIRLRRC